MKGIPIQQKGRRPDKSMFSGEQKVKKMIAVGKAKSFKKLVV